MSKRKREPSPPQPFEVIFSNAPEARPLFRRIMKGYRQRCEAGDGEALLLALDTYFACIQEPELKWLADGVMKAIRKWLAYEVMTLDQAFNVRDRSGEHIDPRRQREALRPVIVLEVIRRSQQGAPIDMSTFTAVGQQLAMSGPTVQRIYYEEASAALRKLLTKIEISENSENR